MGGSRHFGNEAEKAVCKASPMVDYYWRDGIFDALEELRTKELNHRTYGYGRGL